MSTQAPPVLLPLLARDIVCIVGKRGTGKSSCAKVLCRQLREVGHRVVAWDPHDEYSRHGRRSDQVRLGPLGHRMHAEQLFLQPDLLDGDQLSLAVIPSTHPPTMAEQFEEMIETVESTGGLVLVVDEVGEFEVYCRAALNRLATQSRHWGVTCVFVAQRMIQIPKTARTQSTHVVSFLQTDPEDLDAIESLVGRHGGKEFAEAVSHLPQGEWKQWHDEMNHPTHPSP